MRKNSAPNSALVQDQSRHDRQFRRKLRLTRIISALLPISVIIMAVAGFIMMGSLKPEPEEKEDAIKAIPVLTALAVQDDVTLKVNVQGEVEAHTEINLVPQISGKISYISPNFVEGGKIRKGEVLARIEATEFELRVIQARANITQAETVVMREKSEGEIARRDWEELGRSGEPSALSLRLPQLAEANAQLESAKAQLAEAELQLERTSLQAPFAGRVADRVLDLGAFVTTGTGLGTIYATDRMDVRLPMTNQDLREAGLSLGFAASKDNIGKAVKLSADVAGYGAEWTGRIVRTDSRFERDSRILFAYAEVIDPFGEGADQGVPLAPGIFVNAQIQGQTLSNIIRIPRSALRGEDTVFIANPDETLSIKKVTVLSSDREHAILSGGIDSGTNVITSPIRGAANEMKISVVEALKTEPSETEGEK